MITAAPVAIAAAGWALLIACQLDFTHFYILLYKRLSLKY